MITITKLQKGHNIITTEKLILKCYFSENKLWLNKKEIANIFGIKKSEIKSLLASIEETMGESFNQQVQKKYDILLQKDIKYFSLDILLSFGYRIDNFTDTRILMRINRLLKNRNIIKPSLVDTSRVYISHKIIEYSNIVKMNYNTIKNSKLSEISLSGKVFNIKI